MKVSIVGIIIVVQSQLKILNNHGYLTQPRKWADDCLMCIPYLTGVQTQKLKLTMRKRLCKSGFGFCHYSSGVSSSLAEEFVLADFPIIDLSGDHRLPADVYQEWKNHLLSRVCFE